LARILMMGIRAGLIIALRDRDDIVTPDAPVNV
jgi:hypothetical protein